MDYYADLPKEARPPFYKRKRFWIILAILIVIVVVVLVPVLLFVAFPKIAQGSINSSQIEVDVVNITDPTTDSFTLTLQGKLTNAGPIGATIDFDPMDVNWKTSNGSLYKLGSVQLPSVSVSGGSGTLQSTSNFSIVDENAFTQFTEYMLSSSQFTWNLNGTATVKALGRTINNLIVDKDVTLAGFNNFPNVTIQQFSLPSDDPQGGITMKIVTNLPNNSPIAVQLGTIVFAVSFNGTYIGPVQAEGVMLEPSNTNLITLNGRMVAQSNPQDLEKLSALFSDYIAGRTDITTVTGVSAAPDGVNQVSWLTAGLKSVQLQVPLNNGAQATTATKLSKRDTTVPEPSAPAPLNLITGIKIGTMNLQFNASAPYDPTVSSDNVQATFVVPFGFSLSITEVEQNMTIATLDGTQIAKIVSSQFSNATSNQTAGILSFSIANSPLAVIPGQEYNFQLFNRNLTLGTIQNFTVVGSATIGATTPIGPVVLSGIPFSAPVNLTGLDGLINPPPTVESLDVVGGTSEGLQLSIKVDMTNPSNLQISTDDVHFLLNYNNAQVGSVTLPNLTLLRGKQTVQAQSIFASAQGVGQDLLTAFAAHQASDVQILGFNTTNGDFSGTTDIKSLLLALPALNLPSSIPGLQSNLLVSASVQILSNTPETNVAVSGVVISNPFTAALQVTNIASVVKNSIGQIGTINVNLDSAPITIGGKSQGSSGDLPINMNLDPLFVATLLRSQAIINGLDVAPLDALLALGGFHISTKRSIQKRGVFDNFNLAQFVIDAFKNFKVTIELQSTIKIGQYSTPLKYQQDNVPAITDSSITYLIPVVGQPIVQSIVSNSVLSFSTILIKNPTNSGFDVHLVGAITKTGPIDATISFPGGVDLYWNNKKLGNIAMGSISAKANVGAAIDMDASFTITDATALESFSETLLLETSFSWHLQSSSVSVDALGFTFTKINLEKDVSLNGFDGFAPFDGVNALTVVPGSFSLYDPPSEESIGVKISASLRSRSNVGLQATVNFENYFQSTNVDLGTLGGVNVLIAPNPAGTASTTSTLALDGRLTQQSSQEGQNTIAQLFTQYLNGNTTTLYVKGLSAAGPLGTVNWLTQALKKVEIKNIELPGIANGFKLIQSVTLNDAEFDFVEGSAYAPIISSTSITSGFQLPFSFTLAIVQLKQNLIVEAAVPGSGNVPVATISAGYVDATTTATGSTTGSVNFAIPKSSKIPFKVISGAEAIFDAFTTELTEGSNIQFFLGGTVDTVVYTKIATFPINNVPVNVNTQLAGFNNLGGTATIKSLSIDGGSSSGIVIHLTTTITNPSKVTIDVGNVDFDTMFSYGGATAKVGDTIIDSLVLKPGANDYQATFLFNPAQDQTSQLLGSALLSGFLMGGSAELTIKGSANSTSIQSLKAAFSTIHLQAGITGIPPVLIKEADLYTDVTGLLEGQGQSTVSVFNPFNTPIVLAATGVTKVTYNVADYSSCALAVQAGSWEATDFGVQSGKTVGPENVAIAARSNATSSQFAIDLNVSGPEDSRPLIYGLACAQILSVTVTGSDGSGIINTAAVVDIALTATFLVGDSSDPYKVNIQYQQNEVPIILHFNTATAFAGLEKTMYCMKVGTAGSSCCSCALGTAPCPLLACPALLDGTPVGNGTIIAAITNGTNTTDSITSTSSTTLTTLPSSTTDSTTTTTSSSTDSSSTSTSSSSSSSSSSSTSSTSSNSTTSTV